jgi:putative ABC transport system ATP-binding protein
LNSSSLVAEASSVSKIYDQAGTKVEVLRDLNLSVRAGETVAILGQSGSGKSTLLSLLAGLDRPTNGKIRLEGQDLNALPAAELERFRAARLGIVFQSFHLMSHLSALENISLPLEIRGETRYRELAQEALERVGLSHRANHPPQKLSGGERQRVAIARAIVIRPSLLLADEPGGSLDSQTGEKVMQLLFDLVDARKMTLLLVTHDSRLAAQCKRRLWLERGQLREETPP